MLLKPIFFTFEVAGFFWEIYKIISLSQETKQCKRKI